MKNFTIKESSLLRKTIIFIVFLIIWEIVSVYVLPSFSYTEIYFPSFSTTIKALINLMATSEFWYSIFLSLFRVISGFIIAMIFGIFLGVLSLYSRVIYDISSFIMSIVSATPVASFILLALIWINVDHLPIFIGVLMLTPVMFTNIIQGIKNIDKNLLEVTKVYNIKGNKFIFKILLPMLKPYISAALLSSFGLGWKVVISAEVLARPELGIGAGLYNAKILLEFPELFAYTLCVIILSYIFEKVIKYFSSNSMRAKQEGGTA